jgi:hypothetical protein
VLYRRGRKGIWYIGYPLPGGGYRYESTRLTNRRFAQKLEAIRTPKLLKVASTYPDRIPQH